MREKWVLSLGWEDPLEKEIIAIYMRAVVCVLGRGEEGVQMLFKGCM